MMQNLLLKEGSRVACQSVANLQHATFCRFQPHSRDFLDLAASIGPRELLESAIRYYSVLTKGETIMLFFNGCERNASFYFMPRRY